MVLFNFRGDRALEISMAFDDADFTAFDRGRVPDVMYAGMLQYDGDLHIPKNFLVAPPAIHNTLSELLVGAGVGAVRRIRNPEIRPCDLLLERQPQRKVR